MFSSGITSFTEQVRHIDRLCDGSLDDFRFNIFFNSISVILGRCMGDNERLCAMEPRTQWTRSRPQAGLKSGMARPAGQCLTY